MYKFIRFVGTRELFLKQLPTLTVSLVMAELFYKFHSFILECLAFLATWYLLDLLISLVLKLFSSEQARLEQSLKSDGD